MEKIQDFGDVMTTNDWIDEAIVAASRRVRAIAAEVTDFPHVTEDKQWGFTPDGVWTGGFWAGLLWLCYENERTPDLLERAIHFTDRLLPRADDRHNHDLGFMFVPSAIKGWRLTGDPRYHAAAIDAARALAGQYNSQAGYIPGWGFFGSIDWSGSVLIDTLMNMPLLVWAAGQTEAPQLLEVAHAHTATSLAHHFRPDGSVFHMYVFDPATGAPLRGDTYQGHAANSVWSRGQAWAITGLAILAAMTGNQAYRAASERSAAYFLQRLPADGVPPWDFDAPGPNQPKDASAGAIASYGLQKLFAVTGERHYLQSATDLLRDLAESCRNTGDTGGLLLHSTADLPHGLGIDEATMYGDYYYLKSLFALRQQLARKPNKRR